MNKHAFLTALVLFICPGINAWASNVALSGAASQSSDYGPGFAARAIDGNRDGNWYNNSVTHTYNYSAWWQVQLDSSNQISQINIFNRTDCCSERLSSFRLSVLNGANTTYSTDVTSFVSDITGPDIAGMTFNLSGQIGDIVRIELLNPDYLSLAEVEVYGAPVPVPGAVWLFGSAMAGLRFLQGRSKHKSA